MASSCPLSEEEESDNDLDVLIIRKRTSRIVSRINAVDLLDYFKPNVFTEEEREGIKCEHNTKGPTKAARSLLDILIRKSDGWFEHLLEALEHADLEGQYNDIVKLLRKDRDDVRNQSQKMSFQESPEVTGGNMSKPTKPVSKVNSQANTEGLRKVAHLENHKDSCSLSDVLLRGNVGSSLTMTTVVHLTLSEDKINNSTCVRGIKDDEKLKEFNLSPFTGVRAQVEKGGMSKLKQKDVLYAFEKGDHPIAISSSDGDDGIDIPECSRTIRYNHVTNGISMMQLCGHVRPREDREVMLRECGILEKDSKNVIFEEAMVENMKEVTSTSTERFRAFTGKRDALAEGQQMINRKTRLKNWNQADNVKLFCIGCKIFVCMASDIRKYNNNHILVDEKFKELIHFVEHHDKEKADRYNAKKISCKKCGQDWGNTTHRVKCYPCLKISNFFSKIDGQKKFFKQWKQVPYKIIDLSEETD